MVNCEIADVIIIGGGPAGLTAGIYCARALLKTIILEGSVETGEIGGGQLMSTTHIENYPSHVSIDGFQLMANMKNQAVHNGATVLENSALNVSKNENVWCIELNTLEIIKTKTIIIATGAKANLLNIPGHNTFWNNGISACAVCDGALPMFKNKYVAVIGGGDTAFEEALYLAKYASDVYIIMRGSKPRASGIMIKKISENKKIKIINNTVVESAHGKDKLASIKLKNIRDDSVVDFPVSGMFYAIGHTPSTEIFKNIVKLDEHGYVEINDNMQTSVDEIFCAGDAHDKKYRQAITAAGFGCMAALSVVKYLEQ